MTSRDGQFDQSVFSGNDDECKYSGRGEGRSQLR